MNSTKAKMECTPREIVAALRRWASIGPPSNRAEDLSLAADMIESLDSEQSRTRRDWFSDVLDFHRKFCPDLIATTPTLPSFESVALRLRLIHEEVQETRDAMLQEDLPEVADGIADAIYVLLGCAVTYGIDIRPVWDAVHAANMAKEPRRVNGKIAKPPGWTHPDIAGILADQPPLKREP